MVGLPPIDGFTVTEPLPDIDGVGQSYLDLWEIGEPSFDLAEWTGRPGRQLEEYRYRLGRARRRAVRDRLRELVTLIDSCLPLVLSGVARDSQIELDNERTAALSAAVAEIDRLIGETAPRGRWSDLYRHMHVSQGHDWHDIAEFDWPTVKPDIEAAGLSDIDPVPVPDIDLGHAASSNPSGGVTTALDWKQLDDDGFERLLFDLLNALPGYQNVQWLMQTRAPDRGRDLSLERVSDDGAGSVRTERVHVQAKHWLSRSVSVPEIAATVAAVSLWQPPLVRVLILATSGRFTADAVAWAENRNESGTAPHVTLWPDSHLERLLSQKPQIAAAYGLR